MFARISSAIVFVFLAFAVFAAATPTTTVTVTASPTATPMPASQCNTGPIQCCNSVLTADNPVTALLLGLLGIVVSPITAAVGLTCTPILGGGPSCSSQPVCCQNNNFNGLVVVGCTPVNINL